MQVNLFLLTFGQEFGHSLFHRSQAANILLDAMQAGGIHVRSCLHSANTPDIYRIHLVSSVDDAWEEAAGRSYGKQTYRNVS
jgi:hypothetical protein